ncbi:MAG: TlpA disulfide reductase family protein [Alphaproteobacteria bacterium]|nr:TlpA disulfide reductase family protein [Alphaproteobacteria bacterium]
MPGFLENSGSILSVIARRTRREASAEATYPMRSPSRNHFLGLVLLLCIPLVVQGCGEEEGGGAAASKSLAPDFKLTRFDDGGSFRLSDHKGNLVVINFFASWCTTCGIEVNDLEKVYQEFAGKNVMFVGVGIDDTETKARKYVENYGITYPTGLDVTGTIKKGYGIYGLPYTFFVDRKGFITYIHAGAVTESLLKYELEKLL